MVNVHHLADQIERHLAGRAAAADRHLRRARASCSAPAAAWSRRCPRSATAPFFHVNSDTIWIDGVKPNLGRLAAAFDPARMDALLLVAPTASSIGYAGRGDFSMAPDGRLTRRGEREVVPFVYAGAAILTPAFFAGAPRGPVLDVAAVRPRRRSRAALRAAARRGVDACRHARRDQGRRGRDPRQRGVSRALSRHLRSSSPAGRCMIRHGHPARLHHPGLGAVRADADPRADRGNAGAGLSGRRAIRSRSRAPRSTCRRGAPAGWRAISSST